MFDNATLSKLRELRLSTMAASFKEQQDKPDMSSLTFVVFFSATFLRLLETYGFLYRNRKNVVYLER